MWEKEENFYGLHGKLQGIQHEFVQRLLQSCHTLCRISALGKPSLSFIARQIKRLSFLCALLTETTSLPPVHILSSL